MSLNEPRYGKLSPATLAALTAWVAARPRACYRQLERRLTAEADRLQPGWDAGDSGAGALHLLADLRPGCGYSCDGDDGPNPDGSIGCPYAGRPVY